MSTKESNERVRALKLTIDEALDASKLRHADVAQLQRLATLLERYQAEAEAASARVEDIRKLVNGTEWTPEQIAAIANRLGEDCPE